jgi:hypothetical protein
MSENQQTELISLYDYLGKAAGKELGGKVYQFANIMGAKTGTKTVSHSPYQEGRIMTYERHFLDQFFNAESLFNNNLGKYEYSIR